MEARLYKCLVVDDEPIARRIVRNYIEEIGFLYFFAEAKNAIEAMTILKEFNDSIDIVFLDINMPSLSGINMVKILDVKPQIIFTTAYSEFAVESYELNAVDYLLKPFSIERFNMAVVKAKNAIDLQTNVEPTSIIQLRSDGKLYYIDTSDILYCEAMRNYTRVFLKNGNKLMPLMSLSKLEKELEQTTTSFIRVHRSFIVSRKYINTIRGSQILIENHKVPIGEQFKDDFFKVFPKK